MSETNSVRDEVIERSGAAAELDAKYSKDYDEADSAAISRGDTAYTADSLKLLEGVEHVRHRPAMYIGDTGSAGLHHLMFEVLDNSIDEVLAGYATEIWVTLHSDNTVSVRDNGRGIPTDIN